jgi:hypothetical protein
VKLPAFPYAHKGLVACDADLAVLRYSELGHLCGYCAFADAEIPAAWRGSYDAPGLQLLAIHGGLTYAESKDGVSVFGFDCAHSGDSEKAELSDPSHVLELTHQMREQLTAFAAKHEAFLAADRAGKCAILDQIRAAGKLPVQMGLGGMLEVLIGAPSLGEEIRETVQ